MNPGELKHRITFQVQDLEQEEETWNDILSTWANINPISGKEYYSAETINSDLTHKIRLRYRKGITPDMRILYNERIFYIVSVINEYEKNIILSVGSGNLC